ncbi:MAG: hypothetical protein AABY42_09180, partial [Nitrospirota bacterium]
AVGIECRTGDKFINDLIAPLNHSETSICVRAERAFLKRLEGGCQVPIAAYARIEKGQGVEGKGQVNSELRTTNYELLFMDGLVGSIMGDRIIRAHTEGNRENAEALGIQLAEDILSRGGKEILDEVYGRT